MGGVNDGSKDTIKDDNKRPVFDDVWNAVAGAGCSIAGLVISPFTGSVCSPSPRRAEGKPI